MTESAEVVVVGGGALGVLSAYHLNELGVDVLLLERDDIAQATSTCAAGFVGQWAGRMGRSAGARRNSPSSATGSSSIASFTRLTTAFLTARTERCSSRRRPRGGIAFLVPLADCEAVASRRMLARRGDLGE